MTGSYGRLEASKYSDLDIFFVVNDTKKAVKIDPITKTLIDAKLINIIRELGFPEFSNEGQYLEIHYLKEMLGALGGREDDAQNHFTARLLLLLESRPVCNPKAYRAIVGEIVKAYFRDYHEHVTGFRPIFLVNDILRFWRTLCLNYEHKRNRPAKGTATRNKAHLKNLKLKFSRLLTCFSTVMPLAAAKTSSPERVMELIETAPLERLNLLAKTYSYRQAVIQNILNDYVWFLKVTGEQEKRVLKWIGNRANRDRAFKRARRFGMNMYVLLLCGIKERETIRYLII